ncbi:MAG: hypothetical protein DI535_15145 [Citrobacter freundii]|nr:MAG: hypothetical protein DI535_15145 [Citrobacter freundii]
MKKNFIYILLAVVVAAMIILVYAGNKTVGKQLNERLSFLKKDKIPYGAFVAYENLDEIFPSAKISSDRHKPGDWELLSPFAKRQALIIVSPVFNADEEDMDNLLAFVKNGNDVFVSTMKPSYYAEKFLKCDVYYPYNFGTSWRTREDDTLTVSIDVPEQKKPQTFSYPGKQYDFRFYEYDTTTTSILGYNEDGQPNFIKLSAGKGNFYLHLAPMTFTNYFLLHKDNMKYYDKALSVIAPETRQVVWDEYFLSKGDSSDGDRKGPNWLSMFFRDPALRAAMITAMLALLVYVLMEMRRKQRPIPVINPPKNDSLDFVRTIGRLYHDKGDHKNLCSKMAAYFLEHVRTRYKLSTTELDEDFIKNLSFKTGQSEAEIRSIVESILRQQQAVAVSADELISFHKQLESFYKTA